MKVWIPLAFSLIVLSSLVSSEIAFGTFQQTYSPGQAAFAFNITNLLDSRANIWVSALSYPDSQPSYLDSPPYEESLTFAPHESRRFWLNFTIPDSAEAGMHIIKVEVSGDYYDYSEARFIVVDTLKTFNINVVVCKDPCDSYTTSFLLSESPIRVKVLNFEGAALSGAVTTPLRGIQNLQFSQGIALLPLPDAGSYKIEVTVSKTGYKTKKAALVIDALESLPVVVTDMPCNADGICNGLETRQNCPQDCLPGEQGGAVEVEAAPYENASGNGNQTGTNPSPAGGGVDWIPVAIFIVLLAMTLAIWGSRRKR